ncbi:hypothetical protein A4U64_01060 [Rhodococcus sp. WB1]|nr:hypothetical protein A4U64_01060 [Rhodococcus sp. WB1]
MCTSSTAAAASTPLLRHRTLPGLDRIEQAPSDESFDQLGAGPAPEPPQVLDADATTASTRCRWGRPSNSATSRSTAPR